jgi:hypothetical protein
MNYKGVAPFKKDSNSLYSYVQFYFIKKLAVHFKQVMTF